MVINLSPTDQLTGSVNNSISAITVADRSSETILQIQPLGNPNFQVIDQHIITARDNASKWQSLSRPKVVEALSSVKAFGDFFDQQYNSLVSLATSVSGGNSADIVPFQNALQALQLNTKQQKTMVDAISPALKEYSDQVAGDSRNFTSDAQQIQAQIEADQRDLQSLSQQLQDLEKKIEQKKMLESMFPFLGLAGLILELINSQDACEKQYQELTQRYDSEQNELPVLFQISSCLNTLTGSSTMLFNSCLALAEAWDVVDNNFTELLSSENINVKAGWLVESLAASKLDWDNLAGLVKSISGYTFV